MTIILFALKLMKPFAIVQKLNGSTLDKGSSSSNGNPSLCVSYLPISGDYEPPAIKLSKIYQMYKCLDMISLGEAVI